jgi:hypothetical protein
MELERNRNYFVRKRIRRHHRHLPMVKICST